MAVLLAQARDQIGQHDRRTGDDQARTASRGLAAEAAPAANATTAAEATTKDFMRMATPSG
jgi:hypothetical protein